MCHVLNEQIQMFLRFITTTLYVLLFVFMSVGFPVAYIVFTAITKIFPDAFFLHILLLLQST